MCLKNKQTNHQSLLISVWSLVSLPLMWNQNVVDASQFDIDLEAEVREGLRGRFYYVLHLHALGGHAEEGVTHPLHLSCG